MVQMLVAILSMLVADNYFGITDPHNANYYDE